MIDFDAFLRWAEDKFNGEVIVKGKEIKINSIFTEDRKYHLSCSPTGGKNKREDGVYHCWKTGNKGTLLGLVMRVEGCAYQEAQDILGGAISLRVLEEKLHEFFANKEKNPPRPESKIKLPDDSHLIEDLSPQHRMEVENYLNSRRLSSSNLYYCTSGEYRGRIIIPYFDKDGKLIYFNARYVGNSKFRYMGPPKTCGVGKLDVLFASKWPIPGSKIHLTEGEFDALTLTMCGLYGMACGGKILSERQIDMLRPYKVCLCLDTDQTTVEAVAPGLQGLMKMGQLLIAAIIPVTFVRPPKAFKDWNKMLMDLDNPEIIKEYIDKYEKVFDPLTLAQLMCLV